MKKLLYILLLIPFKFFGQGFLAIEQDSPLELAQGWNMFGFNCFEPMNLIDAFSQITDKVILVKDNDGAVYMPEFSFNGIGSLRRNLGYQIKLTEMITDFQFCPFIVPLVEGCMDETAFNYNSDANMDDGSCYPNVLGCLDSSAFNFNDYDYDGNSNEITGINGVDINTDDGSCLIGGCIDSLACNYNSLAETSDASCTYPETGFDCSGNCLLGSKQYFSMTSWPAYNDGWYNAEYTISLDGQTIAQGPSVPYPAYQWASLTDSFCLVDGSYDLYISSNGIFDHSYGWSFGDASGNTGTTVNNIIIGTGSFTQYQVGDFAEGGIIFYLDETGQHGLVAAIEDLTEGGSDPNEWGYNGFEWGCYGEFVDGSDGTSIGTGYQNTMDIVNQDCLTEYGGKSAAQSALDAQINGFSDWHLPSRDELIEMHNSIGNGADNVGGFAINDYWSSSELNIDFAFSVNLGGGAVDFDDFKSDPHRVRLVRAFGDWTMGCMDSLACNYNPEVNMADGSCTYAEQYYDCEGNITEYVIGMEAEGGIVIYIDETGEHGLVAANEDLPGRTENHYLPEGVFFWSDAMNAAASATFQGYDDWYLPSIDELWIVYNTIGQGGGNSGNFFDDTYWSSSMQNGVLPWLIYFNSGGSGYFSEASGSRVRVIRAF